MLVLVALLLALVGGVLVARVRWRAATNALVARLHGALEHAPPAVHFADELDGLPAPVARYFRTVLPAGQRVPRRARIAQRDTFAVKPTPDGWRPFTAVQSGSFPKDHSPTGGARFRTWLTTEPVPWRRGIPH